MLHKNYLCLSTEELVKSKVKDADLIKRIMRIVATNSDFEDILRNYLLQVDIPTESSLVNLCKSSAPEQNLFRSSAPEHKRDAFAELKNTSTFKSSAPSDHVDSRFAFERNLAELTQDNFRLSILDLIQQLDSLSIEEILEKLCKDRKEREELMKQLKKNPGIEHYIRESIKEKLYKQLRQ